MRRTPAPRRPGLLGPTAPGGDAIARWTLPRVHPRQAGTLGEGPGPPSGRATRTARRRREGCSREAHPQARGFTHNGVTRCRRSSRGADPLPGRRADLRAVDVVRPTRAPAARDRGARLARRTRGRRRSRCRTCGEAHPRRCGSSGHAHAGYVRIHPGSPGGATARHFDSELVPVVGARAQASRQPSSSPFGPPRAAPARGRRGCVLGAPAPRFVMDGARGRRADGGVSPRAHAAATAATTVAQRSEGAPARPSGRGGARRGARSGAGARTRQGSPANGAARRRAPRLPGLGAPPILSESRRRGTRPPAPTPTPPASRSARGAGGTRPPRRGAPRRAADRGGPSRSRSRSGGRPRRPGRR